MKIPLSLLEQLLHLGNSDTPFLLCRMLMAGDALQRGWVPAHAESHLCQLPCGPWLWVTACERDLGSPETSLLFICFVSVHAAAEGKAIKPFRGSRDQCHTDQLSSWETLGESVILQVLPARFHSGPDTEVLVWCQFYLELSDSSSLWTEAILTEWYFLKGDGFLFFLRENTLHV